MKHLRVSHVAGLAAVALVLCGCATAKLGEAVDLSAMGGKASADLLTASTKVEASFAQTMKSDRFLRALQAAGGVTGTGCSLRPDPSAVSPAPGNPAPPAATVAKIEQSLRSRTALARGLGKTYSAMNALATYDASGAVSRGLTDVFGATNSLRTTWGLSPIPSNFGTVIAAAGGAFAQKRQVDKLKATSSQVRIALDGYRQALEAGRDPTVSLMKDGISESYALKIALWRRGYLDANGLVARMGQSADLTVPPSPAVRFLATDEALCRGVRASLEGERDALKATAESEYDTQIAVIGQLIDTHEQFERGDGLDPAHLIVLLDTLTALADKLAKGTWD